MKIKLLLMCDGIALSHIVRLMVLVSYLDREKYEIVVAASPEYKHIAVGKADQIIELDTLSVKEFEERENTVTGNIYDKDVLKMYIESDLKIISEVKPDIIIGDLRVSLGITAKISKIPYINIQNAHWSTFSMVDFPMPDFNLLKLFLCIISGMTPTKAQKNFVKAYNEYRIQYGMEKINTFQEFFTSGDLNLYADIPLLSPTRALTDGHAFIGPIIDFIDNPLPSWWDEIKDDKKIVYCTIGSTGSIDKTRKIIKALEKLDVTVIVATAGKIDPSEFPEHFYVSKYVPALKVIEKADLVIFNGGATLYQALSKGKPVLSLPNMVDQFMFSSQIEKLKIGKVLRYNKMNSSNLVKVIRELLSDSTYKENAGKVMNEIKQYNVKERFVSIFEAYIDDLMANKSS
ncbi:nucleotide disphospho-sugar-binding domain-containing protein [Alkaliphilus transvaalensis]|uniref:nucleotide disphospho-sugar-binding domain-containing protein n=1 Tax=Alkaliphilus transvaalensis TaxID=114628 RepID=UPI00047A36EC|nr:nucleotide disphospho-sugar-binding domain-containing protein [Alkaliphilus transvaalensis]